MFLLSLRRLLLTVRHLLLLGIFDDGDEEETESHCSSCGVDRIFSAAAKEAHLKDGVISHHKETLDVDSLFQRMTLKENHSPESNVFTLNKQNIEDFFKQMRENNESPSSQSCQSSSEDVSGDDLFSCLDSDLEACLSQQSLSFLGKKISTEPSTPKMTPKRTLSTGSVGFSLTPKRLKRKTARCLWNPFFMQHTLMGVREIEAWEGEDN